MTDLEWNETVYTLFQEDGWKLYEEHLKATLESLEHAITQPLSSDETNRIRGQIMQLRAFINFPELVAQTIDDLKEDTPAFRD